MYKLQSIIFNKKDFTVYESIKWMMDNNYRIYKLDETNNFYRFRQTDPNLLKKQGYNKIITKEIIKGLKFILYYK